MLPNLMYIDEKNFDLRQRAKYQNNQLWSVSDNVEDKIMNGVSKFSELWFGRLWQPLKFTALFYVLSGLSINIL